MNESPINHICLAGKVKAEIKAINKSYPKLYLAGKCRYLNLAEFLASYEAIGIH